MADSSTIGCNFLLCAGLLARVLVMRIQRWKHENNKQHFLGFIQGFAELLDGCVTIFSLGFYMSSFEMDVARYRALTHIQDLKKARAASLKT